MVANKRQARELLTAVSYVGKNRPHRGPRLAAMFACMYFGGLRPAEEVDLRQGDCELPSTGWGRLYVANTASEVGRRFTDTGRRHDQRGLKHRPDKEVRPVPIPPELVKILRAHIAEFGVAPDGRLFRQPSGAVVAAATYGKVWREARTLAFTPDQVASPLARRPYDLRHAAVSFWLNSGVPATKVALRAGHSVDVLLRVYAKCLDGDDDIANKRIDDALGDD